MSLQRVLRGWVTLWDRREAPTSLALARIFVAAVIVTDLLVMWRYGVIQAVWASPEAGGFAWGAVGPNAPWLARLLGGGGAAALGSWAACLGLVTLFGLGVFPLATGLGYAVLSAQLGHMSPDADRGIDTLLRVAVAILALSQSHARWSLTAWWRARRGRPAVDLVPAWPRYLLFLQMVWMYFSAGSLKGHPAWLPFGDFSALYLILRDPHFARFPGAWLDTFYPVTQLATAGTIVFEWSSPVFLLATLADRRPGFAGWLGRGLRRIRYRWLWLTLGVSLHLGIALTMRLGIFPFGCLALYPVFLAPEELAAAWRWLRARMTPRVAAAG